MDLPPFLRDALGTDAAFFVGIAAAALLAILLVALVYRRRHRRALPPRASWVSGLAKTRGNLTRRLLEAWRGPAEVNEWLLEAEEALLSSDVGAQATRTILDGLRAKLGNVSDRDSLLAALKEEVRGLLVADGLPTAEDKPRVLLVVGVNGVGKTTTIGKLAYRYRQDGKKVLLIAADTFRAAAIEQLAMWAERVGADLVKHQHGADPSAVAFDGVKAAVARGADVAILDTAGRLHVKANLMEELKKISRTVARHVEGAPHEVLLVIDATTGQNALNQARLFNEAIPLTGVVLAKLDGTAKGGIALAICRELNLPIRYVGLGERPNDLAEFDPEAFVNALFADLENPS